MKYHLHKKTEKWAIFLINLILEGDYFSFLDWYSYFKSENFEQSDSTSPKYSFSFFLLVQLFKLMHNGNSLFIFFNFFL